MAVAQPAYADLVATTGPATSVTSTSATLHGVSLTLNPSSSWGFQYGASSAYSSATNGTAIGAGLTALEAIVTGLSPGTTYHFRLVVLQGDSSVLSNWSAGSDVTFTTDSAGAPPPLAGTVSVLSHVLAVAGRVLSIPLACKSGACTGTVALVARRPNGTEAHCGTATVSLHAGQHGTLEPRIGRACSRLLRRAHDHSLRASLSGVFDGAAKPLTALVTLAGR